MKLEIQVRAIECYCVESKHGAVKLGGHDIIIIIMILQM